MGGCFGDVLEPNSCFCSNFAHSADAGGAGVHLCWVGGWTQGENSAHLPACMWPQEASLTNLVRGGSLH